MTMPFGKHKGVPLSELDDEYFEWLCSIELRQPLAAAVIWEMARRRKFEQEDYAYTTGPSLRDPHDRALAAELISCGRRSLASRYHPDKGGSLEVMSRVNQIADYLLSDLRLN